MERSEASSHLQPPWELVPVNVTRFMDLTDDTANDTEPLEAQPEQHQQSKDDQQWAGQELESLWEKEDAKIQQERAREENAHVRADQARSDLASREKDMWDLQHRLQQLRAEYSATAAELERVERDRDVATQNESEAHTAFVAAQALLDKYVNKTSDLAQQQAELDGNRSSVELESQRTAQLVRELFQQGSSAYSRHEALTNQTEHEDRALARTVEDEANASRQLKLIAHRRDANEKLISLAEQRTAATAPRYTAKIDRIHHKQLAQTWQHEMRKAANLERKKADNHSSVFRDLVRTWLVQEHEAHVRAAKTDELLLNRSRVADDLEARRAAVTERYNALNARASSDSAIVAQQQGRESAARSQKMSTDAQLKGSTEAVREWTTKENLAHQALLEANQRISEIKTNVTAWRKAEEEAHERRQQSEHQREAMLKAALEARGGQM